jgi:hypothetical protein
MPLTFRGCLCFSPSQMVFLNETKILFYMENRLTLNIQIKVANIRCFILIKCSEQEARFKKICYNVVISEKNSNVCW